MEIAQVMNIAASETAPRSIKHTASQQFLICSRAPLRQAPLLSKETKAVIRKIMPK
jgi:hypothetical protein